MEHEMDQFIVALTKRFAEMEQRLTDLEERCDELEVEDDPDPGRPVPPHGSGP